jgi:hypothetical protein
VPGTKCTTWARLLLLPRRLLSPGRVTFDFTCPVRPALKRLLWAGPD